jgi:hypothetical protein
MTFKRNKWEKRTAQCGPIDYCRYMDIFLPKKKMPWLPQQQGIREM